MHKKGVNNPQGANLSGKIFWSLAPLLWGGVTWFLAYGPGASLPISYAMRMLIGILILVAYFYKPLEYAAKHNRILFFEYPMSPPRWTLPVFTTITLLLTYNLYSLFFSWDSSPFFNSLLFGIFAGPCLEELIARSFFVKYRMSGVAFIVFNTISATAFTLMHAGFEQIPASLHELFFARGHFAFGFLLGIIAYKTQRIEIPILLHMASNFFRYTLPTIILHQPFPIIYPLFMAVELLVVGGMHKREPQE